MTQKENKMSFKIGDLLTSRNFLKEPYFALILDIRSVRDSTYSHKMDTEYDVFYPDVEKYETLGWTTLYNTFEAKQNLPWQIKANRANIRSWQQK